MKTKYLDAEIERLNLLERNNELTDWGKEMLIELKEIKQALLIQRVSNSVICDDWIHEERVKQNDDTYCPICGKQLQSK
tara:strand:+ start:360 stop:596 length:237 start_codon:yes stop_codon:yes gene_type:complete